MSQPRGAHRAAPVNGPFSHTWRRVLAGWLERRSDVRRPRHAAPLPHPRWRRGSALALAGLTTLGAGTAMSQLGVLPAMAEASPLAPGIRLGGLEPEAAVRPAAPATVPLRSWIVERVREAQTAERAAATARVAAEQQAKAQALAAAIADPRGTAKRLAAERGWGGAELTCLDTLWHKESTWRYTATNPSSGAYGIPQSLPAEKMASAGADWRTNPATQIAWGLGYIRSAYGTPCNALSFHLGHNWY